MPRLNRRQQAFQPVRGREGQLERPFNYPTAVPYSLAYPEIPVGELLERVALASPQAPAIEFLGHRISYAQLNHHADRLAAWLQSREIHAGERVGVMLPNCPEYLVALYGIWRAGAVAVSISPLSVPNDIADLLKLTSCRHVISLDLFAGSIAHDLIDHRLSVSFGRYLSPVKRALYACARWKRTGYFLEQSSPDQTDFWQAIEAAQHPLIPTEILPQHDPAYILSTGGTTGNPKAVTLSHRNIVANAWQQWHWLRSGKSPQNSKQESMLAVLPFFHSYGMSTMAACGIAMGARLIIQPRFDAAKVLSAIETQRPTILHAVPAMLTALNDRLRRRRTDLSSLKWVISGGAPLPREVGRQFQRHCAAEVVEGFGLSEASPVTHVGPLDGTNIPGTIGLPLPNTECRIVDLANDQQDVLTGDVGELLIRGPQVMLGYWNNRAATAEAIDSDGWLHTGDLARLTIGGYYQIVDRKKDLIITSGFNVYPADVEEALRQCPGIRDAAVVGVPDSRRGEVVKAFVVLHAGQHWNQAKVETFCKGRLAKHRRPKHWEVVDGDLPRNFLGKVVRRQLRTTGR